MKSRLISVVIATFNRTDFLLKCVESVLSGEYRDFEIIIVDQGRDGRTKKEVAERYGKDSRVRYFYSEVTGLSHARNFGCKEARGGIIAYIDDDAIASPGWLKAYAEVFTAIKPAPGMAGGKILPIWEKPCPEWYPEERRFLLGLYDIGDRIQEFPGNDFPPGANFAVLRKAVEDLGGFDRRLGFDEGRKNSMIAGEDTLMGKRVKEAGYSIYYHPEAQVNHYIAGYKLQKKYFLRRHYWEGITVINIMDAQKHFDRKQLLGFFKWQLKALGKSGADRITFSEKKVSGKSSKMMLYLSHMFFSLGMCVRLFKILVGRR